MSTELGSLPATLPTLAPPVDRDAWLAARDRRRALCEAAAADPAALPLALAAWDLPAGVLAAAAAGLAVPDSPEVAALCAWVGGPGPAAGPPRAEVDWDRAALGAARAGGAADRRVAALYLLARLGEELDLRERHLPRKTLWRPDARDRAAAAAWAGLLGPTPDLAAGAAFRSLFGGRVRAAFQGVSAVLGLPGEVGRQHGEAALDQLDLVGVGAHRDLATRLLETAGEPVARLEAALGTAGRDRVAACVAGRRSWSEVGSLLGRGAEGLGEGADAVVFLRLVDGLSRGRARPHEAGLPGWAVVAANRSRIRGRLRAVAGEEPAAFRAALLGLDALYARTSAATARFAWAWAWREARRGFGFDLDRMRAAPCTLPPPGPAPLPPLGEAELPAVRAFLLVAIGRGCQADLERWVAGAGGRELSRTFYRCLEQLPDAVADPPAGGGRHRGYHRLVDHLADDGLEELLGEVRALAARVAAVPGGPGLRDRVAAALAEPWAGTGMPLPRHHLSTFQDNCALFAAGGGAVGAG